MPNTQSLNWQVEAGTAIASAQLTENNDSVTAATTAAEIIAAGTETPTQILRKRILAELNFEPKKLGRIPVFSDRGVALLS